MALPDPIRFDHDTWLCMRNDPTQPKAVIRRYRSRSGVETYLVLKWDLDPAKQLVMASTGSLEKANELVQLEAPPTQRKQAPGYPKNFFEPPNDKRPPQPPSPKGR